MREYEDKLAAKNERVKARAEARATDTDCVSSSAMDQGDESSVNSDSVPVSIQGQSCCELNSKHILLPIFRLK